MFLFVPLSLQTIFLLLHLFFASFSNNFLPLHHLLFFYHFVISFPNRIRHLRFKLPLLPHRLLCLTVDRPVSNRLTLGRPGGHPSQAEPPQQPPAADGGGGVRLPSAGHPGGVLRAPAGQPRGQRPPLQAPRRPRRGGGPPAPRRTGALPEQWRAAAPEPLR